jgi:Flp pilus assembly protein TadD
LVWILGLLALVAVGATWWRFAIAPSTEPLTPLALAQAGLPRLLEQVRAEPRSMEARLDLGACYVVLEDRIGAWQQLSIAERAVGSPSGALAAVRRMRARTAEALGQFDDAVAATERAWRAAPEDLSLALDLHRRLTLQGEFERALTIARAALARHPSDAKALAAAGEALFNTARYPQAIDHLRAARLAAPEDLAVATQLGLALLRAGRGEEALPLLGEVVTMPAAPPQAWEFLGQAQLARKQAGDARTSFQHAGAAGTTGGAAAYGLAQAALALGETAAAENALVRAVERDPGHDAAVAALVRLLESAGRRAEAAAVSGRALLATGEAAAAVERLRVAAALEPKSVRRWRDLAQALQFVEDGPGALAALRRAQALAPEDAGVAAQQIEMALAVFASQEALRGCERYARLAPTGAADTEWWRFRAYRQLQDTPRARAALQAAAKAAPDRPEFLMWQGRMLLEEAPTAEQLSEAERFLERARALRPDDPEILGVLAEICIRQKRWEEAGTLLRRALARDPHVETPWLQLARVDRALGRSEEAAWDTERYRASAAHRADLERRRADAAAHPQDGARHAARSQAALRAGRLKEAWTAARVAVRLSTADLRARRALAVACQRLGRLEERIAAVEGS